MVVNIVSNLTTIGFSEYEARAFAALSQRNPATAYEVAKSSGIPSSKIYEVLFKLRERGIVTELAENSKKRYIPIDPHEFIETYRTHFEITLNTLSTEFANIYDKQDVSYIWNITDYTSFIQRARRMISKASDHLLVSTWRQEASELHDELSHGDRRGIKIAVVHFGKPEIALGQIFQHPIEDTLYQEKGGRGFSMVADSKEALTCSIYRDNTLEGAWSKNHGFVTLAEDYIKHDIYIMKIVRRFDQMLIYKFGTGYSRLRDVFSDSEEQNDSLY